MMAMQLCCAQRFHIISCKNQGKSQAETYMLLREVYGDDSLSVTTCRRWFLRAKEGDKSGKDAERPSCKPTAHTLSNVHAVQAVLDTDRRATVRQIATEVQLSRGSVHQILQEDLSMKKKAPKFVPRLLNDEQKRIRVDLCHENLCRCEDPLFLWSVITGDESWFSVLEPEQKVKSLQWIAKGEGWPKKALHSRQARKTLMEVFFDDQGIIHLEFLPPKMTVTSHVYCGILVHLREAIRHKRPSLWKDDRYHILHDNAPGHKANHTVMAMMETNMSTVSHPPYSPDLAPADFWLFPYLKEQIRGCIFRSIPELQDALMVVIQCTPMRLFHDCIHKKLPDHWRKCIASGGDYFEGDHVELPSDSALLESDSDTE